MTKYKKMLSVGLAGCMAASALMMGAGATDFSVSVDETAPSALSASAGDTLECNLVVVGADGSATENFFDIDLPSDATNADQKEMVMDKVNDLTAGPATRAARGSWYTLCSRENISVPKNTGSSSMISPNAASAYMDGNYDKAELYMSRVSPAIGRLNVRIECVPSGSHHSTTLMNQTVSNRQCVVVVYNDTLDPELSGSPVLSLRAGNSLNAYVSGVSGSGTMDAVLSGYGSW